MNSIKKNFIYNSLYQLLVIVVPLITTPYLSRILGATGIGEYSYAFSVSSYFVMFIMLGLNNYGNREVAKCRDNVNELSRIFWSIYAMQLVMGILVVSAYIVYIMSVKDRILPVILGIYVLSGCFDVNWFCFGIEQFKFIAIRNTIIKLISTILIFVFVKTSRDVGGYCLIISLGQLLGALVVWPKLIRHINFYKPTIKEIRRHIKPNLFLFMTVVAVSLFKIMDKIMLGIITTAEQVGFYEVAEKIIAIPTVFITSLGTVMLPRMSNLAGKGKTEENRLLYASAIFAMFMVSSLCFGIMGVSKTFVPFFYGQGYDICIVLYLILLPSCLFLGLANVVRTQYLLPHNMDKEYVVSAFLGAFVNILINLCLIPKWGAIGAAIGTLVAEITVCVYQCYMCRKGIQFFIIIRKSLIFVIDGIIMFLILFNLKIPVENLLLKLGVQIGMGGIIYLMLLTMEVIIYKKIFKQKFFSIKNIC